MKKMTLIAGVLSLTASLACADLLIGYDFNGYAGSEGEGTSTVSEVTGMSTPAYITRGAGISEAANGNRFNANNWVEADLTDAIANGDYFEWTVSAQAGYVFTVTNVGFNFQRSSTGPADYTLRSSVDGYASDLDTFVGLANGSSVESDIDDLSDLSTVTFRFYGYGNSNTAGTSGFEGTGNDLRIEGTISAIPEPATAALAAIGAAAAVLFRRRKQG